MFGSQVPRLISPSNLRDEWSRIALPLQERIERYLSMTISYYSIVISRSERPEQGLLLNARRFHL